MYRVLVVLPVAERHKKILEINASNCEFLYRNLDELNADVLSSIDIIIGNIPPDKVKLCSNLKWMQLNSAGTDGYLEKGIIPQNAVLTNATGAYGLAISEHMLAQLLCLQKKFNLYMLDQENHIWGDRGTVTSIEGSHILVVGLGNIGSEFAKKVHALGAHVYGIRRTVSEKPDFLDVLYTSESLKSIIGKMDVVALSLPGTKETINLFNKEVLFSMKKGSILLNVGRGNAVDTSALIEALNSGHLAGAALDVTSPEPLPKDHPLWDANNILITPHISGFYHLPETFERIIAIAADNLKRFTHGEPMINIIDFETGYCKK